MQNNTLSSNPPSYIAHYGMKRDPFSYEVEDDLFYAEPVRKQRLDILLHLAQYGNELMVITGPRGSGKTTLLQQFQSKALDTWTVACIEADGGIDERKLLQQLYHQMGMEFRGATHPELLEQMEHHFDSLQHSARLGVMLIDNAEQLPVTALKNVLEMASLTNTENKPLLRIILFATENIDEHFKDPQLGHFSNLPRRKMDLPPFSEEQTAHYILHRLSAANFSASEPFTESVLLKIHRESYGWPARINELSHDVLAKTLPTKAQAPLPGMDTKTFRPARLVAVVITTAVIAALLIFQNDINNFMEPGKDPASKSAKNISLPLPLPEQEVEVEPEPKFKPSNTQEKPNETSTANIEPINSMASTVDNKLNKTDTPITEQAVKQSIEQSVDSPEKPATRTLAKIKPEVPAQQAAPITTTTTTTETRPKTKSVKPQNTPAADINIPRKEAWILEQNPTSYTMQVVAGENITTIEKFIWEHKLKKNIAFYHSIRRNKPWYGLIYGIYSDKQAAINARSQLPKKLRRLKPWIRDINSVHQDIHKISP